MYRPVIGAFVAGDIHRDRSTGWVLRERKISADQGTAIIRVAHLSLRRHSKHHAGNGEPKSTLGHLPLPFEHGA
jgi:hypothetical protein